MRRQRCEKIAEWFNQLPVSKKIFLGLVVMGISAGAGTGLGEVYYQQHPSTDRSHAHTNGAVIGLITSLVLIGIAYALIKKVNASQSSSRPSFSIEQLDRFAALGSPLINRAIAGYSSMQSGDPLPPDVESTAYQQG